MTLRLNKHDQPANQLDEVSKRSNVCLAYINQTQWNRSIGNWHD